MAILKVARMGHPVLRKPTQKLSRKEILTAKTQQLVDDMIETMHEYHGVGLAAPQVHESKRLLVVEVKPNPRYPEVGVVPLTVLFNVHINDFSKETEEDWEGCLSIPGLRGIVPRATAIELQALDRNGKEVSFKASGFFARVLQHEVDHLDGILFPERIRDLSTLAFEEELQRFPRNDAN